MLRQCVRRNQMLGRRWALEKTVNVLLEHPVGIGHAIVLPQVLEP